MTAPNARGYGLSSSRVPETLTVTSPWASSLPASLAAELYDHGIAVNALAPWDKVATPGAGHHDLVQGFAVEGVEWMAEAALVLCSSPPKQLAGRVAYSQPVLAELKLRPKGL